MSFFTDVCGLELNPKTAEAAAAYRQTTESGCWWWPHHDFVIACERPSAIYRDPQGRLHSGSEQAIYWPDGFGIYAWHGTVVPDEWIKQQDRLDAVTVLRWGNADQRRAGAEIIGWKRLIEQLQPRVIDKDWNPQIGTLLEVDLPDAPGERFLQVKCGTGRDFVIPVPKQYATALEANAATYNVSPSLLRRIEVRT